MVRTAGAPATAAAIAPPAATPIFAARPKEGAVAFKKKALAWKTLQDLHQFVFTAHNAYASQRLLKVREAVDPAVLKTY